VGVIPDAVAVDGVFVAPVPVPDVKLPLLIVLLAAAVAVLDVLAADCIPTRLADCWIGSVVGTKVGKEVMGIEGRAGMYELATTVLEGDTSPIAVEVPPSVDPPPVPFPENDEDGDPMACPSTLINGSVTDSGAVGDRPLAPIPKAVKGEGKV